MLNLENLLYYYENLGFLYRKNHKSSQTKFAFFYHKKAKTGNNKKKFGGNK